MKNCIKGILKFIKNYYFIPFCFLAMLLPEIMMRGLVGEGAFLEDWAINIPRIFTSLWMILIVWLTVFVLPKKWGRIVFGSFMGLIIIFSFAEYIYHTIFGQFFWLKSIALAGEGGDYLAFATGVIERRLLVYTFFTVLATVIAIIGWTRPPQKTKFTAIFLILPILGLFITSVWMLPEVHNDKMDDWDAWRRPRIVYKNFTDANKGMEIAGLYQFVFRDIHKTIFPSNKVSSDDIKAVDEYFEKKGELLENEYTALFEGKNVIVVMMESMDTWLLDKKHTPTIHKMMKEGINFTNYNPPFFGSGFTFGAEFAFNTGFFTPSSAVTAANFAKNSYPYSIANLFREKGYNTNSFHFNSPEFYSRGVMHKSLGYEKYNIPAEYGLTGFESRMDSNLVRHDAFYEKMTEKTPFMDFIITYTAHLPYTDDEKMAWAKAYRPDLINPKVDWEKNNGQILAADTDKMFELLLERLKEDGLLKDTVIVAFTDHYAYGISDEEKLKQFKPGLKYTVPAFIWAEDIEHFETDKPMMTSDWLPTLVNLFGLRRDIKFMGNDILEPTNEGFGLFETRGWMLGDIHYDPSLGIEETSDMELIEKQGKRVEEYIRINDFVVLGDYYK